MSNGRDYWYCPFWEEDCWRNLEQRFLCHLRWHLHTENWWRRLTRYNVTDLSPKRHSTGDSVEFRATSLGRDSLTELAIGGKNWPILSFLSVLVAFFCTKWMEPPMIYMKTITCSLHILFSCPGAISFLLKILTESRTGDTLFSILSFNINQMSKNLYL